MLNEADDLIHQPLRLKIMACLHGLPAREPIEFTRLKSIVEATDGNLGAHLGTLERAGYLKVEKDFVGKKPRTRIGITPAGRRAFLAHIGYLRELIDSATPS